MTDEHDAGDLLAGHLRTIRDAWADTESPMKLGDGHGCGDPTLPSSTITLRADITHALAFWVHAWVDNHPDALRSVEMVDGKLVTYTRTLDLADVPAVCEWLTAQLPALRTWVDDQDRPYLATMLDEIEPLANEARMVSKPPRKDRHVLGPCPDCGRDVRAKAVPWVRLPQPTTDPAAYPLWTEYVPAHERPIRCACGRTESMAGWFAAIVGTQRALTASQLVEHIHATLGMRHSPITVRVWARRGLVRSLGQSREGAALYDRVQVLAALMDRGTNRSA